MRGSFGISAFPKMRMDEGHESEVGKERDWSSIDRGIRGLAARIGSAIECKIRTVDTVSVGTSTLCIDSRS